MVPYVFDHTRTHDILPLIQQGAIEILEKDDLCTFKVKELLGSTKQ